MSHWHAIVISLHELCLTVLRRIRPRVKSFARWVPFRPLYTPPRSSQFPAASLDASLFVPLRDLLVYSMPLVKHLNGSQSQHRPQSFSEVADGADCRDVKVSEGIRGNYGGNCLTLAWMCWAGVIKIGAVARDL